MTILDQIVEFKKREVALLKNERSISYFESQKDFKRSKLSLKAALRQKTFGIIGEIKRKSPSAGDILHNVDVCDLGQTYAESGICGISCLTDGRFFGGSVDDLIALRKRVEIPILRKEFIIDHIQLFEAKAAGADAILLIAGILSKQQIKEFVRISHDLNLEVILEVHSKIEIDKITGDEDIIGVNNRNLHLQKTDLQTSTDLFPYLPSEKLKISESGIKTRHEIMDLHQLGYNGALIGESILKNENTNQFISELQTIKA